MIIVSHECREHLLACLTDLGEARNAIDLWVTVVDNASSDGTVDMVRHNHPWVSLDPLDENIGFGRANNRALERVRTENVLLLNPDTRVNADELTACVCELANRHDVGVLTPRVVDGSGMFDRRCIRGFPTLWSLACHVTRLDRVLRGHRARRYAQRWLSGTQEADVEAVSGAVMFCRTAALRAVGGFDERFFMYGEDIDLCLRVRTVGWRVVFWPGASITHIGGGAVTNRRAQAAWARAIGDLHRVHRPGVAGRLAGAVCDTAGRILAPGWFRGRITPRADPSKR